MRPFDQQHPVRGNFDDPRIGYSVLTDEPLEQFHFGIDISAADGTPVFAVEAGVARVHLQTVSLLRAFDRGFAYWHVLPAVRSGDRLAFHQLVGWVADGWGHVHFAEIVGGNYVNPLRPGGIAPYDDDTVPTIGAVSFVRADRAEDPTYVSGTVDLTVDAYDTPSIAPPPPWQDSRVTPALIRWRVLEGAREVLPWRTAVDFRYQLLPRSLFEAVYAPGTQQNEPGRPGRYVFHLDHHFRRKHACS